MNLDKVPFLKQALDQVPDKVKNTLKLQAFGLTKVPMLLYLTPVVEDCTDERCEVRIPLSYRSKNHLNSMYFGSLAAGADCAAGLLVIDRVLKSKAKYSFAFKDFKADFMKRAEADTHFICEDGKIVDAMMEEANSTGERVNRLVRVKAICPKKFGKEPVATFELTMSIKKQ